MSVQVQREIAALVSKSLTGCTIICFRFPLQEIIEVKILKQKETAARFHPSSSGTIDQMRDSWLRTRVGGTGGRRSAALPAAVVYLKLLLIGPGRKVASHPHAGVAQRGRKAAD